MQVFFSSLGCSKNLVDSEVMLGKLAEVNITITDDPKIADILIVNTCSFIADAREESVEVILELLDYKKDMRYRCKVFVVAGCLSQRYFKELEYELPEVDLFVGTGEYYRIATLIDSVLKESSIADDSSSNPKSVVSVPTYIHSEKDLRVNTSPFYMSWLKISEGCNRNCSYCAIPIIRGKMRSRTVNSLAIETRKLVDSGVKEINLISQDLSLYGKDLSNKKVDNLELLLDQLEKISGLDWIRLLYFYPDELTDSFISKISESRKICNYLDMPVQHFSNKILANMNRNITGDIILNKIKKLRGKIPDITLRSSLIVGFPGESDEDFKRLLEGIDNAQFDHLGIFKYSDEEGTKSFNMANKVSQDKIEERFFTAYELQKEIVTKRNIKRIGKVIPVIVEGVHEETDLLIRGRSIYQAPEIDGKVIINDTGDRILNLGDIVNVEISEIIEYDFIGRVV